LGLAVGDGDRALVLLPLDGDVVVEIAQRQLGRAFGGCHGGVVAGAPGGVHRHSLVNGDVAALTPSAAPAAPGIPPCSASWSAATRTAATAGTPPGPAARRGGGGWFCRACRPCCTSSVRPSESWPCRGAGTAPCGRCRGASGCRSGAPSSRSCRRSPCRRRGG